MNMRQLWVAVRMSMLTRLPWLDKRGLLRLGNVGFTDALTLISVLFEVTKER